MEGTGGRWWRTCRPSCWAPPLRPQCSSSLVPLCRLSQPPWRACVERRLAAARRSARNPLKCWSPSGAPRCCLLPSAMQVCLPCEAPVRPPPIGTRQPRCVCAAYFNFLHNWALSVERLGIPYFIAGEPRCTSALAAVANSSTPSWLLLCPATRLSALWCHGLPASQLSAAGV